MFRTLALFSLLAGCMAPTFVAEPTAVVVHARPPVAAPPPPAPRRIERIVVTDTIEFETNRDILRDDSKRVLDNIAAQLSQHPELVKVRVEGHTDSEGTSLDNMTLSRKRAAAVRAYLIGRGIDGARLIAEGYGDTNPIATNANESGRSKNRRVAFTILDRTDGAP